MILEDLIGYVIAGGCDKKRIDNSFICRHGLLSLHPNFELRLLVFLCGINLNCLSFLLVPATDWAKFIVVLLRPITDPFNLQISFLMFIALLFTDDLGLLVSSVSARGFILAPA